MSITLQQKYLKKRLNEVSQKAREAEEVLLKTSLKEDSDDQINILLEALDEEEYKQATEVIEKLQKINDIAGKSNMDLLTGAIDTIVKEINNFTGGGGLTRFKGKLSSLFSKNPSKNPILAGLAMVGALEAGFKALPAILKNNIKDIEKDKEKQGMKLIELIQDDDKLKKNVENTLIKAFVPSGTFGKVFGKIPGIDTNKLVGDLMNATPAQLGEISKVLDSGAKVSDVDPKLADPKEAGDPNAAGTGQEKGKDDAGKAKLSPEEQKKQVVAIQSVAKEAGIKEEETITRFLSNVMDWSDGIKHPNADIAISVLKDYAYNKAKITKGQLDGFVDGITIDQKQVKTAIEKLVKDKIEKEKAAAESKKKSGKKKANTPAAGGAAPAA